MHFIFLLISPVLAYVVQKPELLTGDELVHYLNTHQKSFVAQAHGLSISQMKQKVMDPKYLSAGKTPISPSKYWIKEDAIPVSFDSRQVWSNCASIGHIRDQSTCGSCWAVSSAEVMTDRICIKSNGTLNPSISAEDILSCCSQYYDDCGSCSGGWPYNAFDFWNAAGVVTGGDFGKDDGCMPYQISPCGLHDGINYGPCPKEEPPTPKCSYSCTQNYPKSYKDDKTFGTPSYRIRTNSAIDIQREILTNGPVVTCFDVYSDFYSYKKGVYIHTAGDYVGGHCVKILGWGVDSGTPYWTIANSWSDTFGEQGYFRIIRGLNECRVEEWVFAAEPRF